MTWWGFAALMVQLALSTGLEARVLGVTFLVTSAVTLFASGGKHLAWPVFLLIGGACLFAGIVANT